MLISNDRSIGKKYGVGYKAKSMLYLTPLRIPPLLTLGGFCLERREKSHAAATLREGERSESYTPLVPIKVHVQLNRIFVVS